MYSMRSPAQPEKSHILLMLLSKDYMPPKKFVNRGLCRDTVTLSSPIGAIPDHGMPACLCPHLWSPADCCEPKITALKYGGRDAPVCQVSRKI